MVMGRFATEWEAKQFAADLEYYQPVIEYRGA
jgi:hypothetical protein